MLEKLRLDFVETSENYETFLEILRIYLMILLVLRKTCFEWGAED